MNILTLLSPSYYFDLTPPVEFGMKYIFIIFFLLHFFGPQIAKSVGPKTSQFKNFIKDKLEVFPYLGSLGIVFVLFRVAGIPVFSMRLLLFTVTLLSLFFLGRIFYQAHKASKR